MSEIKFQLTEEIKERIQGEFDKYFKDSMLSVTPAPMGKNGFFVKVRLCTGKSEVAGGILDNDFMKFLFHVTKIGENNFVIERVLSYFHIKSHNKMVCSETVGIPFRKSKGDIDKMISVISKQFKKTNEYVREYSDSIKALYNPLDKLV